ncbi:MAG: tetratricopeptide repeat protein [Desulfovibrionaceae bacterium]
MFKNIWKFLKNETNRKALTLLGPVVVAVVSGGWALFQWLNEPADKTAPAKTPPAVQIGNSTGITTGTGDIIIQSGASVIQNITQGIPPETIERMIAAIKAQPKANDQELKDLAGHLGIHEQAVAGMLRTLGESNVPLESLPQKLGEIADRHLELERQLRALNSGDPEVDRLRAEAAQALERGEYDRVDALLAQALAIDTDALGKQKKVLDARQRSAADTLGLRGDLARTRLDYRAAAANYVRAAETLPEGDAEGRDTFYRRQAHALYLQGEEFGDNQALKDCIEVQQALLKRCPRNQRPLDWAMTQNNLGTALSTLGEREDGTQQLERAVDAYRAALQEYPRAQTPLNWAKIQNNLGAALNALGERESGTQRLEQAVDAYRAALLERTRTRAPLQWAKTQINLGVALRILGERGNDTRRLEQAVDAYRDALLECTRERAPLLWAAARNNQGNALRALGERENDTRRLEQAVDAYRDALRERTRKRVPLDWAITQNNLGDTLAMLAERTGDTSELDEMAATLHEALEVTRQGGADHHAQTIAETLQRIEKLLPPK